MSKQNIFFAKANLFLKVDIFPIKSPTYTKSCTLTDVSCEISRETLFSFFENSNVNKTLHFMRQIYDILWDFLMIHKALI